MNIFSANGALSLLTGVNEDSQRLNRAKIIHRDNERSNLETITRLVIRSLLEDAMRGSNRLIEGDSQMLSDFLMMLEKILFHGFKSSMKNSLIALRTPDSELWAMLTKIGRITEPIRESVSCIDKLDTLVTPISKIRGILRLTMMQKKLSELFESIVHFPFIRDYYESWAFLTQEKAVILCGALVGIRVIECNLVLDYDNLQEQPLSVDLSIYVKIPTVSNCDENNGEEMSESERKKYDNERKMLLDQNNYLEERIRQLETNLEEAKRKNEIERVSNNPVSINSFSEVSYRTSNEGEPNQNNSNGLERKLEELKIENDSFATKIVELQDTIQLSEQQVKDKSKVCTDLYENLRLSEECIRKLENDFLKLKEHYNEDKEVLCEKIRKFQAKNEELEAKLNEKVSGDDNLRTEFQKKCEQYGIMIQNLETKQKLLSEAETKVHKLEQEVSSTKKELQELPFLKDENIELKSRLKDEIARREESELALEELGGRLSESKLRMVELTEELLPLSDAQWANDSDVTNCTACRDLFTFSKRKHHCRMCGSIFCSACSEARVKLPSNSKPARVCENCFLILKTRNNSKN